MHLIFYRITFSFFLIYCNKVLTKKSNTYSLKHILRWFHPLYYINVYLSLFFFVFRNKLWIFHIANYIKILHHIKSRLRTFTLIVQEPSKRHSWNFGSLNDTPNNLWLVLHRMQIRNLAGSRSQKSFEKTSQSQYQSDGQTERFFF